MAIPKKKGKCTCKGKPEAYMCTECVIKAMGGRGNPKTKFL
jgi:hypothetical protein